MAECGSEFLYDFYCHICDEDGRHLEAVGYCRNCRDYLCQNCYKYHCKPKPLRHHVLEKIQDMQLDKPATAGAGAREVEDMTRDRPHAILHLRKVKAINYVSEINIRQDNEEYTHTTGSALLSSALLAITDIVSSKIKLIDTVLEKVISSLPSPKPPHCIIKVGAMELAVTIPDLHKIQFVHVQNDNTLTMGRKHISTNGMCYGIACAQDRLIVAFDGPPKVEILDMNGTVVQRIDKDDAGANILERPEYVAVNSTNNWIYVADEHGHNDSSRLVIMTMTGKIKKIYTDLFHSRDMVFDKYNNLLCVENYCLNIRAPDHLESQPLPGYGEQPRQIYPYSVSLCEVAGKLYVGGYGQPQIIVYKVFYCN